MTIDTTVTNGRFVGPNGVFEHSILIHAGRVLDTPEFDDVWRTIDASGHLVFPGMIQHAADDLLALVRRGVTTVIGAGGNNLPLDSVSDPGDRQPRRVSSEDEPSYDPADNLMIELPVQVIEHVPGWWDIVTDNAASVHVTCGDDPSFPLLQFLYQRGLSPERITQVTSIIPARWYGIYPDKGSFDPGTHGDLLVFDPDSSDPYHDDTLPGRIIMSIQRGEMLLYNGQIHAPEAAGRQLLS